jgi:hypothetical protein
MATYTFEATVRLPNAGTTQKVTVKADSSVNAKAMLESQYGHGNIIGSIVRKG